MSFPAANTTPLAHRIRSMVPKASFLVVNMMPLAQHSVFRFGLPQAGKLPASNRCVLPFTVRPLGIPRAISRAGRSSYRRGRAAYSFAFASSDSAALTAALAPLAVREIVPGAPVGRVVNGTLCLYVLQWR